MATPATSVPPSDLPAAIDCYSGKVIDRFAVTLREQLAGLREPTAYVATDRALRQCGYLIETLAGFARGAALAPIHAMARRYGASSADLDREAMTDVGAPLAMIGTSIADADRRPLVDTLGTHLHRRIAYDVHVIRAHASRLLRSVAEPKRAVASIEVAAHDTASALRFADQIGYGWTTFGAALTGAAAPAIEHVRSRDLWHGWLRAVRGERLVGRTAPKHIGGGDAPVTEWIMQIA